jgi:hypothetical protein
MRWVVPLAFVVTALAGRADATGTFTWTGSGSDGKWGTGANWSQVGGPPHLFPGSDGSQDDEADILLATTVSLDKDFAGSPVAIGKLVLGGSGVTALNLGGGTSAGLRVTGDVVMSGGDTIDIQGQLLEVAGNVTLGGTGSPAAIKDTGSGTFKLDATAPGTTTIGGANADVTVNDLIVGGTANPQTRQAGCRIQAKGSVTVSAGATLDLNGNDLSCGATFPDTSSTGAATLLVNGSIANGAASGVLLIGKSTGMSGAGTVSVYDCTFATGSGSGQTTTIAVDLNVANLFTMKSKHDANLAAKLTLTGGTGSPLNPISSGGGKLSFTAGATLVYAESTNTTISDSAISGNYANLRILAAAGVPTFTFASTKTISGRLEVVNGVLQITTNNNRTVSGDLSLGTTLDLGTTGTGRIDALAMGTTTLTVGGGDITFGANGNFLDAAGTSRTPPAILTLNGTGQITIPSGVTAEFADLNVGNGNATTEIKGGGTLRVNSTTTATGTGTLTTASGGTLRGGGDVADTATIEIAKDGTRFSGTGTFTANNLTVKYSATGASSVVRNVTYKHLVIATGTQLATVANTPLNVTGNLTIQSGTLRLDAASAVLNVTGVTDVQSTGTLATGSTSGAATANLATGLVLIPTSVSIAGTVSVGGTSLSMNVQNGDMNVTGTGNVDTKGGAISVTNGKLSVTGGGSVQTGAGSITTGGNLETASSATVTTTNVTVGGAVLNAATLTINGSASQVTGNFSTTGALSLNGSPLKIGGTWSSSGSFTATSGRVLEFNGGNQTITSGGVTLPTVEKSTSGTLSFLDTTTLSGGITVSSGVVDLNGQTVKVGASVSVTGSLADSASGLLEFTGSGNLGGAGSTSLKNLQVDSGKTTTLAGAVSIATNATVKTTGAKLDVNGKPFSVGGLLTIETGSTFDAFTTSGAVVTLNHVTNNGTFDAPGGEMLVAGIFDNNATLNPHGGTINFNGNSSEFRRGTAQIASFKVTGASLQATEGLSFTGTGAVTGGTLSITSGDLIVAGTLQCNQPVTYVGSSATSPQFTLANFSGTISGTQSFTLENAHYRGTGGTITVASFIYKGTGTARNAASRAYGGEVQFTATSATQFDLDGLAAMSVTGNLTISTNATLSTAGATTFNALSVGGNLVVNGGTFLDSRMAGASALSVTGALTVQSGGSANLGSTAAGTDVATVGSVSASGTSLDLADFSNVKVGGAFTHSAGTLSAPGTLTFTGAASSLSTAATIHGLTVQTGGSLTLQANLALDGDLQVQTGAGYLANGKTLRFAPAGGCNWEDQTASQNFGDVTVDVGTVTAVTNLTVNNLVVDGDTQTPMGTFSLGNNTITIRGNLDVTSGSITPGGSTLLFAGTGQNTVTSPSAGGNTFHNVSVSKTGTGGKLTFSDPVTLNGNLTISAGEVVFPVTATVGGSTLVDNATKLTLPNPGATQTYVFSGQLRVATGGTLAFTKTGSTDATISLPNGLLVEQSGSFTVNASTASGIVMFKFGANSVSRVGPTSASNTDTTDFQLHGNPAFSSPDSITKNVRLVLDGTPNSAQWFLTYNRQTDPGNPPTLLTGIYVQDSNANAGNLVKAANSENGGNNENWNFGGLNTLSGTLSTGASNVRVKLFVDQGAKKLSFTTTTKTGGTYSFDLTIDEDNSGNDPFSLFVVGQAGTKAVATGRLTSPGGLGTGRTVNLTAGRLTLVDEVAQPTALDDAILSSVDFSSVNDSDLLFDVSGGSVTVNGGLIFDVATPLTTAGGITASGAMNAQDTTTVGGALNVTGNLSVSASKTLHVTGNTVVSGTLGVSGTFTADGAATITGATTVSGTLNANAAFNAAAVTVQSGGAVNIAASAPFTATTMTIDANATVTSAALLTTSSDLTINSGTPNGAYNANANTAVGGNFNLQGTFTPASGVQVAVAGGVTIPSTATIVGSSPWNLLLNGAGNQSTTIDKAIQQVTVTKSTGTATLGGTGPLSVASLTVSSSGTGECSLGQNLSATGSVNVTGGKLKTGGKNLSAGLDLIIAGGSLEAQSGELINVTGNWALILGSFVPSQSEVVLKGTPATPSQVTGSFETQFYKLTVDTGAAAKLLINTTVKRVLRIKSNASLDAGSATITLSANAADLAAEGTGVTAIMVEGSGATAGTFDEATSTVKYTGDTTGGEIAINSSTGPLVEYFNLDINGTGTFEPNTATLTVLKDLKVTGSGTLKLGDIANTSVNVSGRVTVGASGHITAASASMFVDGDWTMGSATGYSGSGSAKVTLAGSSTAKVTSAGSTFRNLTIAKLGSARADTQDDTLISAALDVTSGELRLGGKNLTLSGAGNVAAAGVITQNLDSAGSPVPGGTFKLNHTSGSIPLTFTGPVSVNDLTFTGGGTTAYNGTAPLQVAGTLTVGLTTEAQVLDHVSGSIVITRSDNTIVQPLVIGSNASYGAQSSASLTLKSTVADSSPSAPVQVPIDRATYNDLTLLAGNVATTFRLTGTGPLSIARDLALSLGTGAGFDSNTKKVRFQTASNGTFTSNGKAFAAIDVDKSGGKLTLSGALAMTGQLHVLNGTLDQAGNNLTVTNGPVNVDTGALLTDTGATRGTLQLDGTTPQLSVGGTGSVNVGTLNLPVATTLTGPGTVTVNDKLTSGTGAIALAATAGGTKLTFSGAGGVATPLQLGAGGLSADAGSIVTYQGSGSVNVTAASYGNLVVNGSGTFTLAGNTTVQTDLSVSSGELKTGGAARTLAVSGATTISTGATLTVQATDLLTAGTSLTANGTLRLAGTSGNLASLAATSGTYAATVGASGTLNASFFAISGVNASGIAVQATATVALSNGSIDVVNAGRGLDFADRSSNLVNPDLTFTSVKFTTSGTPTGTTNVRAQGSNSSTYKLTFNNTFTGEAHPDNDGLIGNLWGDAFDADGKDADPTSAVSQGITVWNDGTAPTIVSITTFDEKDSAGASVPDGSIDRMRVVFNESIDPATISTAAAGFSIGGVSAATAAAGPTTKEIDVFFANAAQAPGTEKKTVVYSSTAGTVKDRSGIALATVTVDKASVTAPQTFDAAGPVILTAVYNNLNNSNVADDTVTLTFSEKLAVLPTSPVSGATDLTTTGFAIAGAIAGTAPTSSIVVTQNGSGAAAPTALGATIAFTGGLGSAVRDEASNPPTAGNKPAVISAPPPPAGFFDFVVSTSATLLTAGDAVEITVEARNLSDAPIANYAPAQGIRIELLDTAMAANPALATKPGDFSNFFITSTRGGSFARDNTTGTVVITALNFDSSGRYTFTIENTKASQNVPSPADRIRVRVTDIATGLSGDPGINRGTLPLAQAIGWKHGTAANILTLLGGAADSVHEVLAQGTRSKNYDTAVTITGSARFEIDDAGSDYKVQVFVTDQFFNVVTDGSGDQEVLVKPGFVAPAPDPDANRTLDLAGTPEGPTQKATPANGAKEILVRTFRAALDHRLQANYTTPNPLVTPIPSHTFDVFPGKTADVVLILPGQELVQGVRAGTGRPYVTGTPFGSVGGSAGQDSPFDVAVYAVDAHGNWNFQHELDGGNDALILRTLDDPSSFEGAAAANPVGRRYGTSISAINGATSIGPIPDKLEVTFNEDATPSFIDNVFIDLKNRFTSTEIRDAFQSQLSAAPGATEAATLAQVIAFPQFRRFLVRSGVSAGTQKSEVIIDREVNVPSSAASLLKLGRFFDDPLTNAGRASIEFPLEQFTPTAAGSTDADLATYVGSTGTPGRLAFEYGVAFFQTRSSVPTSTATRKVEVTLLNPVGAQRTFDSDGFKVEQGQLQVVSVVLEDTARLGQIDRVTINFRPGLGATVDPAAVGNLSASDFRLTFVSGTDVITRAGTTVRAVNGNLGVEVTFANGIPATGPASAFSLAGPSIAGLPTGTIFSGAFAPIVDGAPPAILSTAVRDRDGNGKPDLLEVTFSEAIEFRAGAAAIVGAPLVGTNFTNAAGKDLTIEVNDGLSTVTVTAVFNAGTAFNNIVATLNSALAPGGNAIGRAEFTADGRFVIRSVATGAAAQIHVTGGTAQADLGLDASARLELPGSDAGIVGDPADFLVLSSRGENLLAGASGSIHAEGNRLFIELNNTTGDLSAPRLFFLDDYTGNVIEDLAVTQTLGTTTYGPNSSGAFLTNVVNVANLNTNSGFVRVRERDANLGDGLLEDTPPGAVAIDLDLSALDVATITSIGVVNLRGPTVYANDPSTGAIPPAVLFPSGASASGFSLGASLARAQFVFSALTPGDYQFGVEIELANPPTGLAVQPGSTAATRKISRTITVAVVDRPPVADAGRGPIVLERPTSGSVSFKLDGSLSTDPNGLHVAQTSPVNGVKGMQFSWSAPSGFLITSSTSAVTSAFINSTTPVGVHTITLTVKDGAGSQALSSSASVTVVVQDPADHVPTADAGFDQVARSGQLVKLDGRLSEDVESGNAVSFTWTQTAGTTVTLSDATTARPSFRAPNAAGVLSFKLVVGDGAHTSPPATVNVLVVNDLDLAVGEFRPPFGKFVIADRDGDQVPETFAAVRSRTMLDASASQALPRVASYVWSQVGGPTAPLDPSGDSMSFVPLMTGTYRFRLVVANAQAVQGLPFELTVPVVDTATAVGAPVATIAGLPASTVDISSGPVSLDAGGSLNSQGVTLTNLAFRWRQVAGPLSPMSSNEGAMISVTPTLPGVYTYEVTVIDTTNNASASALVTFGVNDAGAEDLIPVARIENVSDLQVDQTAVLNGSRSTDPLFRPLEFQFVETAGLPSVLSGGSGPVQTFAPASPGGYAFTLYVFNGRRRSIGQSVSFDVTGQPHAGANPEPPAPAAGGGGGGGGGGGCAFAAGQGEASALGAILPLAGLAAALVLRKRKVFALARRAAAVAVACLAFAGAGCASGLIGGVIALSAGGGGGGAPDLTQPDLVVSGVSGPKNATVISTTNPLTNRTEQTVVFDGDGGRLRANIMNTGDDVGAGFEIGWYLSKVKAIDSSAVRVRFEKVTDTLPIGGAIRVVSEGGTEPKTQPMSTGTLLAPGRYFLLARVNDGAAKITELDDKNNDFLADGEVDLYAAPSTPVPPGAVDIVIDRVDAPTAALTNVTQTGAIVVKNLGASLVVPLAGTYAVRLSADATIDAGDIVAGTGGFTIPAAATETAFTVPIRFRSATAGRYNLAVEITLADANSENNFRFARAPIAFYNQNRIFDNGAVLPLTNPGDPTVLDITTQRPELSTSLARGGQRMVAFRLPDTGLDPLVAQALITVNSADFDPIAELLSPAGGSIRVVDDFAGSQRAVIYVNLTASRSNPTFFLVVTATDAAASGGFSVSIDVNSTKAGDDRGVVANDVGDLMDAATEEVVFDDASELAYDFQFRGLENEFFFTVPAPGHFPLAVRPVGSSAPIDPLSLDPDATTLVRYDASGKPTKIPLVLERGANGELLLNSIVGDGSFDLVPGDYILVLRAGFIPIFLDQDFQLVVGPKVLFDRTVN